MEATLNALGLIFVIGLTIYMLVKWRGGPIKFGKTTVACLSGFGLFVISEVFGTHMCNSGQPFTQCVIPGICLTLLLMFLPYEAKPTKIGSLVIITFSLLLSYHFMSVVHTDQFNGNPSGIIRSNRNLSKSYLDNVQDQLKSANNNEIIPAGWFTDSAVRKHLPEELFANDSRIHFSPLETYPLWHTWLTGIYGKRKTAQEELWYPGGKIEDAIDKIEFRVKNPEPDSHD